MLDRPFTRYGSLGTVWRLLTVITFPFNMLFLSSDVTFLSVFLMAICAVVFIWAIFTIFVRTERHPISAIYGVYHGKSDIDPDGQNRLRRFISLGKCQKGHASLEECIGCQVSPAFLKEVEVEQIGSDWLAGKILMNRSFVPVRKGCKADS